MYSLVLKSNAWVMLDLPLHYSIQILHRSEASTSVHRLLISGETTTRCVHDFLIYLLLESLRVVWIQRRCTLKFTVHIMRENELFRKNSQVQICLLPANTSQNSTLRAVYASCKVEAQDVTGVQILLWDPSGKMQHRSPSGPESRHGAALEPPLGCDLWKPNGIFPHSLLE